jgi:hypothetical protein
MRSERSVVGHNDSYLLYFALSDAIVDGTGSEEVLLDDFYVEAFISAESTEPLSPDPGLGISEVPSSR